MCISVVVHIVITIEPPRSQVALPGTIVNYTCHGVGYVELKFNGTIIAGGNPVGDEYLSNLGINYVKLETCTYEISINASTKNNGTFFVCEDDHDDPSSKIYIYTVDGKGQQII